MALPNTFAAATSATGAQLDANFNATGKIGSIPCTASGQNAITLTQVASISPTISAYANGLQFGSVVVTTNNAATTLRVGSLAALVCYKDSPAGPVALSGGELIAGNAFTAVYDSSLNSGAGGWHIVTNTAFSGGTLSGSLANITLLGGSLGVFGGAGTLGNTLTSVLLTGSSLSVVAAYGSYGALQVGTLGSTLATLTKLLSAVGTLTYSVTPSLNVQDQNIVMAGAQIRDVISIGLGTSVPSGAGFTGFCGTIGTVTVRLLNPTSSSIAAVTMTVRAMAMGLTP